MSELKVGHIISHPDLRTVHRPVDFRTQKSKHIHVDAGLDLVDASYSFAVVDMDGVCSPGKCGETVSFDETIKGARAGKHVELTEKKVIKAKDRNVRLPKDARFLIVNIVRVPSVRGFGGMSESYPAYNTYLCQAMKGDKLDPEGIKVRFCSGSGGLRGWIDPTKFTIHGQLERKVTFV